MTDKDIEQSVQFKDSRHFTIEDGAGLGTRFPLYIDAFIVQLDIAQTFYRIRSRG